MGLDMNLYRVSKPETVGEGDRIDYDMQLRECKGIEFIAADDPCLSDTVRKNSVMCFVKDRQILYEQILTDLFMLIGVKAKSAESYAAAFHSCRFFTKDNTYYVRFTASDKKAVRFLSRLGANSKRGKTASFVLENTDKFNIVCSVHDKDSIYIGQQRLCEAELSYDGKYTKNEWSKRCAFTLTDLAYQRGGLNETGWELLPENCTLCDDKELVHRLVDKGGLSREFIEKWEDGVTVFYVWW